MRVALCDDHAIVRSGLRRILDEEPDLEVVGEAGTAAEALDLVATERPDVLVLDIGLPDTSGLNAVEGLRRASPATRVLMLTVHDDVAYLRRAFDAGASGYLLKEAADVELVQAVHEVAAGRSYVHPRLGAALLAPDAPGPRPAGPGGELSGRELEVLRLIALGLTNPEIAKDLYVSVRTVETHRAHIQQKLDVRNRAELVRLARDWGLLDEPPGR
ncbi:MAG: response regulator transcription factor [Actinobacteria bacterium]|nr:response regulator transcription factor [Actinomycetota bacterium]